MSVIPPGTMGPYPVAIEYIGSDDFDSERLTAYEFGYRVQATSELILDAALYYNDYDSLRQTSIGSPVPDGLPPTVMILPVTATNDTEGKVYGFELAADWRPLAWLRFQTAYTYMAFHYGSFAFV